MTDIVQAVLRAFGLVFAMTWEILWALALGFTLSARRPGGRLQARDDAATGR